MSKKRKNCKYLEKAVMWYCYQCGAYNLHALDREEFECINCVYTFYALAQAETLKKEIE